MLRAAKGERGVCGKLLVVRVVLGTIRLWCRAPYGGGARRRTARVGWKWEFQKSFVYL